MRPVMKTQLPLPPRKGTMGDPAASTLLRCLTMKIYDGRRCTEAEKMRKGWLRIFQAMLLSAHPGIAIHE